MKKIRSGVFETNSSTTHSLVIGSKEDFERWEKGEMIWDSIEEKFITKEEADILIQLFDRIKWHFKTYENFGNGLECDYGDFKSPSGDEMRWMAEYGYNY